MLECLVIVLVFAFPFISCAFYKKRFFALGPASIMGLTIGIPWDFVSASHFHTWFWIENA